MKEIISMSIKELDRLDIIKQVVQRTMNQTQAADILGIKVRQIQRLVKKYKRNGAKGLISQQRGKVGNRQLPGFVKELAVA